MAISSHGTVLAMAEGGVFTAVGEVRDITGPTMRREAEVVHSANPHEPPAPVVSHTEAAEMSFEINYTAHESQQRLRSVLVEMVAVPFELTFPTSPPETVAFEGYVTEFEPLAPAEGVLRANVVVTVASTIDSRSDT